MQVFKRISAGAGFCAWAGAAALLVCALPAEAAKSMASVKAQFSEAIAFDSSRPMRELAASAMLIRRFSVSGDAEPLEVRPERESVRPITDNGFSGDNALGGSTAGRSPLTSLSLSAPLLTFEGLSNQDNFDLFGFRVNPPDPVGDVGPNHYVEMVNLAYAVFSKTGQKLLGPVDTGTLWAGFVIPDCTDASGDPVVVYDQLADRWILSQFTTRGFDPPFLAPNYNCVAISQTGDPTGAYYRYAFITQPDLVDGGYFFPDYPKYGVWTNSYIMTTRDFGFANRYGISVYALEKAKMIAGNPNARAVQFFLEDGKVPLEWIGDGLLPADIDGKRRPEDNDAAPIVGTMDDGAGYGASYDAINIFDLTVRWSKTPVATLTGPTQLPVAAFDSIFPCGVVPGTLPRSSRDCLPQPGITNGSQYIDVLSYRQRPTYRLAYRNMDDHDSLVTNQSVEARPGIAGVRWYEIRRTQGTYSIHQQGTYSPDDGVHRWMGSAAMDRRGNMAIGYSAVNGVGLFPGIRYAGRLNSDPLGDLSLGEGTIVSGTGVQRTTNSRWGDYSSLNIDPVDDCSFWYVNEYYTLAGQLSSVSGWQTRIGKFSLPNCR